MNIKKDNPMKVCIYHSNCADGFASAWIVHKKFGDDVSFFPGVYQNRLPDVENKDVIIVDFSYKRKDMETICKKAKSVILLDHHESAAEDLKGLDKQFSNIEIIFDMKRSGCMITWDYFFPNEECPELLNHIQDRDLWNFKLDHTKEIQLCVFSYPYELDVWTKLFETPIEELKKEGSILMRKHNKDIMEFIDVARHELDIDGFIVPAINVPYTMGSDAAHILAKNAPFAAYYYDIEGYRIFGLRSRKEGENVQKIAVKYGGGGHRNAAGFKVPLNKISSFEVYHP